MKNNNTLVTQKLNLILKQTRKLLKINKDQNDQKIMFDMLSAVNEASFLLKEAWEISLLHNIADDKLRKDFTDMLIQFQEIKTNISADLKYKH